MKVLFVHNGLRSFISADLDILKSHHEVRVLASSVRRQDPRVVQRDVAWCDVVFGWWASWHMLQPALVARRLGKPVVVVGGDYDVIFDPYARSLGRRLRDVARYALGYALFPTIDCFLPFSEFAAATARKLPYVRGERITCLYLGLADRMPVEPARPRDNVLTVASVNRYDIVRKGLATYTRAAHLLPQRSFHLVGAWQDDAVNVLRRLNDRNVVYTGQLTDEELTREMSAAGVYVQASRHECFGMALAEAMLCRCAPVVTDRGSIPEIVGDTGLYVPYGDGAATAAAIEKAFARRPELGDRARQRILELYPLAERRRRLLDIVAAFVAGPRH